MARRGLRELGAEIDPAALAAALEAARGDARIVLNALEAAAVLASHGNPDGTGSAPSSAGRRGLLFLGSQKRGRERAGKRGQNEAFQDSHGLSRVVGL